MPKSYYMVGDIHGCFQTYLALEKRIFKHAKKNNRTPVIVSVGDLIDRGPDSAAVVEHFREGQNKETHFAVMGNHDSLLLQIMWEFSPWPVSWGKLPDFLPSLQEEYQQKKEDSAQLSFEDYRIYIKCLWLTQGGFETLQSFGVDPFDTSSWKLPKESVQFLLALPLFWKNQNCIVTHALAEKEQWKDLEVLCAKKTLNQEEKQTLQELAHSAMWNRKHPTERIDPKRFHISGHTPIKKVKRSKEKGFLQIDTSCVYGEKLSTWCNQTEQVLSVSNQEEGILKKKKPSKTKKPKA